MGLFGLLVAAITSAASFLTGVASVPVTGHPQGIDVDTSTNRVYVAQAFTSSVAVLDGSTNAVLAQIPVGFNPTALAVNSATHQVYVANRAAGTFSVIDGTTNTLVTTVGVGSTPSSVAVNPITGRVYIALTHSHAVAVIDPALNVAVNYIPVALPQGVAVNPTTNKIYATSGFSAGLLSVIDGATETVTAEVTVPADAWDGGGRLISQPRLRFELEQ